jgi:lysophospholipase L1-like esterase
MPIKFFKIISITLAALLSIGLAGLYIIGNETILITFITAVIVSSLIICFVFSKHRISINIILLMTVASFIVMPEHVLLFSNFHYSRIGKIKEGQESDRFGARITESRLKENFFTFDPELYWITGPTDPRYNYFAFNDSNLLNDSNIQIDYHLGFFGDSVTATGIPPYGITAQQVIRSGLKNPNVYSSIFGVAGYSSFQGKIMLQRAIKKHKKMDYAIFFFGYNDHWISFWGDLEDADKMYAISDRAKMLEIIMSNYKTAAYIVSVLDRFVLPRKEQKSIRTKHATYRVSLEDYKKNLSEMVEISRRNNITPVLITAPLGLDPGKRLTKDYPLLMTMEVLPPETDLRELHDSYNNVVRRLADEKKVYLVDLDRIIQSKGIDNSAGVYPLEPVHPTQLGYIMMGIVIGKELLSHILYKSNQSIQ